MAPLLYSRELQVGRRSSRWAASGVPRQLLQLPAALPCQAPPHARLHSMHRPATQLCPASLQMGDEKKPKRIPLGTAVAKGIIANETLAYFIGRTYLFAQRASQWGGVCGGGRLAGWTNG